MKLLKSCLLRHKHSILCWFLFVLIFGITFYLYELPLFAVLYPALVCTFIGILFLALNYGKLLKKHRELNRIASAGKILLKELPEAETIAEEDYKKIIEVLEKTIIEIETAATIKYNDMTDYFTVWAHQIKTPIAAMQISLDKEDSAFSRQLSAELARIESYVEMVMVFLRLDSTDSDYLFAAADLDEIIRKAVKGFAAEFIGKKIILCFEPTETTVITDKKWLTFVIEQILSNALKYTKTGSVSVTMKEPYLLIITDTGIGIAPEDLPRIFEKGYTGFNGRNHKKASGLGLYLCKAICTNLDIDIYAKSEQGKGTSIYLKFNQNQPISE